MVFPSAVRGATPLVIAKTTWSPAQQRLLADGGHCPPGHALAACSQGRLSCTSRELLPGGGKAAPVIDLFLSETPGEGGTEYKAINHACRLVAVPQEVGLCGHLLTPQSSFAAKLPLNGMVRAWPSGHLALAGWLCRSPDSPASACPLLLGAPCEVPWEPV